jgi:hypothetical protein
MISPYLWSDNELTSFINQAVNEACLRARLNVDTTTPDVALINVVAGTASYPIHQAVFQIERAFLATSAETLYPFGFSELDQLDQSWAQRSGRPKFYNLDMNHYMDGGELKHRLTINPTPIINEKLQLTVYRLPLEDMSGDADEPDVPLVYQPDLLHWVCHLAYLKQDSEVANPKAAMEFEQRFEAAFGKRRTATVQELYRKNRHLRVVGRYV